MLDHKDSKTNSMLRAHPSFRVADLPALQQIFSATSICGSRIISCLSFLLWNYLEPLLDCLVCTLNSCLKLPTNLSVLRH